MRKSERQSKAWKALLIQAERSPIQLSFRGVNDKDEALYEVKNRQGEAICSLGTEKDVIQSLEKVSG
jgi:hypothetical protein